MQTEIIDLSTAVHHVGKYVLISSDGFSLLGTLADVSTHEDLYSLTITNESTKLPLHTDIVLKNTDLQNDHVTISVNEPLPAIPPGSLIYVKASTNTRAPINTLYSYSDSLDRWVCWNTKLHRVPLREEEITEYDIVDITNLSQGGYTSNEVHTN